MLRKLKEIFAAELFTSSRPVLTDAQVKFWQENGYLILPKCISDAERKIIADVVANEIKGEKGNDHVIDILSGPNKGKFYRMDEVAKEDLKEVFKINNLFARVENVRKVALNEYLKGALTQLLEGEPLICNSLNFAKGSQQPYHFDTWYMPPPVENRMIAANIALEDVNDDNGPFTYYPGSHKIPAYKFSNGSLNAIPEEIPACNEYTLGEIKKRGLKAEVFSCKAGDVFLWHAQLYHGGSAIKNMDLTRKSLVVHYWRKQDLQPSEIRQDKHGAYLGRTLRGEITF